MKNEKEKFKKEFERRIYQFTLRLLKFISTLPKETVCRIISDQLIRSGTSIGANYMEAQASSSKRDFANFFHYSLKSCNESKFWLNILKDLDKGNRKEIEYLLKELIEIANVFASSLLTIKGKRKPRT
jgi:four helix bundle protein